MEKGTYKVNSYICEKHGEVAFVDQDGNSVMCAKCYEELKDKKMDQSGWTLENLNKHFHFNKKRKKMTKKTEPRRLRTCFIEVGKDLTIESWEKILSVSDIQDWSGCRGYFVLLGHEAIVEEVKEAQMGGIVCA